MRPCGPLTDPAMSRSSFNLGDPRTHLAVYLSDPDGNDLELAWDRPFEQWRRYGSGDAPPNDGKLELDELLTHRS